MERRALLAAIASTGAVAGTGCLESGSEDAGDPDATTTPSTRATPDASEEPPRLVEQSLTVGDSGCGDDHGTSESTIGDNRVTVEGTIGGSNSCYTARLAEASYDETDDELAVVVESYDDAGEREVCQSCIVAIDYVARFEFEGGQPSGVAVEHSGVDGA